MVTTVLALFFSMFLAAFLMPADVVSQLMFTEFIFLISAASLMFFAITRFGFGKEDQSKKYKNRVLVGSVILNLMLQFVGICLIYLGYVTPREALVLCCVLLLLGLVLLKKLVLD